ncbi:MAG: alpha/beta hydrolase [Bacilli bacterium]
MKNKKALVLIHGFSEDCEISFSQFLSNVQLDEYELIKHTISGHGKLNENFQYDLEIKRTNNLMSTVITNYQKVIIMGFSLGGVLAGYIASKYQVNKLILVAPAYKYINTNSISTYFLASAKEIVKIKKVKQGLNNMIKNNFHEEDNIISDFTNEDYNGIPSIKNFIKLIEYIKSEIVAINVPTLIIHGECDELIPISSSLYILSKISNNNKHLIIVPTMFHRLLNDTHAKPYHLLIETFIKKGIVELNIT